MFRYRSATHFIDMFRTYYGPMVEAFAALDEGGQKALTSDLKILIDQFYNAEDGAMVVPGEYLDVVVVRK